MASGQNGTSREAALGYARRGWGVLPLHERSKAPATQHGGVHSARTDVEAIEFWWSVRPDTNVGIACGGQGPDVLDVDDLETEIGQAIAAWCREHEVPEVRTGRGSQFYFAGTAGTTFRHGAGELRRLGGYVVAVPSVHPSGRRYEWVREPDDVLPALPDAIVAELRDGAWSLEASGKLKGFGGGIAAGWGRGEAPDVDQVEPGAMYDYLGDFAVRLLRRGIFDQEAIENALLDEFERVRVPGGAYGGDARDTIKLARWAANSDIAERERADAVVPELWLSSLIEHTTQPPLETSNVVVLSSPKRRRQHTRPGSKPRPPRVPTLPERAS